MVRCHNCGFLAIWNSVDLVLVEAPEHFRREGALANHNKSLLTCAPKCFIRKADLERELVTDTQLKHLFNLGDGIKRVIQQERSCDGFTAWLQGFHPKEIKRMQDDRIALNLQNSQSNRSLMIALLAVVVAAGGAGSTAYFNMRSAHLQIEAHTTAATMQIESQERLLKLQLASQKDPVINVTVEMPSEKNIPRVKQSIHPKTTHDLKPQQP